MLRTKRTRLIAVLASGVLTVSLIGGCSSKRQIDVEETNSFRIEGTSWYGFCQGANAFIYVPGKNHSDPDELEAVVYDDYRCIKDINPSAKPSGSSKPDTDPDGIVDDED
jgi:hypothetical protein